MSTPNLTRREKELHEAYELGQKCYEKQGTLFNGHPYQNDFEAMKAFARGLNDARQVERDYWDGNW